MTSFENEFDNDSVYDFDDIDVEEIKRIILSNMRHSIFCDLTIGRSDDGLVPYDSVEVNNFIEDNQDNIEMAAAEMFAAYEEEDDLRSLNDPCMDLFNEFLYEYVNTRFWRNDEDDEDDEDEDTLN